MPAIDSSTGARSGANDAAQIDWDLFDQRANDLGAASEAAKAELAGVDQSTLWRWRNGKTRMDIDRAIHIARSIDVPLGELVR